MKAANKVVARRILNKLEKEQQEGNCLPGFGFSRSVKNSARTQKQLEKAEQAVRAGNADGALTAEQVKEMAETYKKHGITPGKIMQENHMRNMRASLVCFTVRI